VSPLLFVGELRTFSAAEVVGNEVQVPPSGIAVRTPKPRPLATEGHGLAREGYEAPVSLNLNIDRQSPRQQHKSRRARHPSVRLNRQFDRGADRVNFHRAVNRHDRNPRYLFDGGVHRSMVVPVAAFDHPK
jgi:hypothetical protein